VLAGRPHEKGCEQGQWDGTSGVFHCNRVYALRMGSLGYWHEFNTNAETST